MSNETNTPAPKLITDQRSAENKVAGVAGPNLVAPKAKVEKVAPVVTPVVTPTERAPIVNSQKLPWPQDTAGITSRFKREACRAVGRMGGKPERLAMIKEVLEVISNYADDKFEYQVQVNDNAIAERKRREAQEVLQRQRETEVYVDEITRQSESLNAEAIRLRQELEAAKAEVK